MSSARASADAAARRAPPVGANGFTLLETLIALVVASILSIGLVRFLAASNQIVRHADARITVATLVAELGAALPPSGQLTALERTGARGDLRWTVRAVPVPQPKRPVRAALREGEEEAPPPPPSPWRRYVVDIEVRSGDAVLDHVRTIRLGKAGQERSP